jgi:hypothetical protein
MFDLLSYFDEVVVFAQKALTDYSTEHGVASAMVFHVQATHGSIEVYASTSLSLDDLDDLMETPLADAGDFVPWRESYLKRDSNLGDGGFNDYVTLMVGDAVTKACSNLSSSQLPVAILVHAAFESAGTYGIELHPRSDTQMHR